MKDTEFSVKPFNAEAFADLLMKPNVSIGFGGFDAPELEELVNDNKKTKPAQQHKKRKKSNKK